MNNKFWFNDISGFSSNDSFPTLNIYLTFFGVFHDIDITEILSLLPPLQYTT